ncbi:MAG TPA: helix-turn-helix transcriptional regulator [Bacillota bacterium]
MTDGPRGIGERTKRLRQQRGLSLTALARRAGISKAYLSQLENDAAKKPSVDIVMQLAKALDVSVTELMGIDDRNGLDPASLPPGLRIFWAEHPELRLEDIRVLASLHYRGARPQTATDYWLLYHTLRLTVTRHLGRGGGDRRV